MLLATCRFTISHLFNHTFFFSFLFRTVLIRFADRGLVDKGRLNTGLFNKLYWSILLTFCCYAILMAPLISIMKGSYKTTIFAKICLLCPIVHKNDDFMYARVAPMILGVFIPMFFLQVFKLQIIALYQGYLPK